MVTLGEGEGNSVWEGTWDNFCGTGKVRFLDLVWVLYFTMRIKKKKDIADSGRAQVIDFPF